MKVLGRLPTAAVVAVLTVVNTAASSAVPPRETLEHTRTRARTASLLNRPSADSAVKLIFQMDAERQEAQSRLLFGLYPFRYAYPRPRPRLLFFYPSYIERNPPGKGVILWDVPHVSQHSRYWANIRYVRRVSIFGHGSYLDPREISEIGWDRALSRVPGVVVR